MTDRLYYENSYLKTFDAKVLAAAKGENGRDLARLDRSAFYPTSGGQPFDAGRLGNANVTNVYADEAGEVWHELDAPLSEGEIVRGEIDWARRFDHMQQHAGEHMLAGAAYRRLGGHTIGLHLGAYDSSIDVELPGGETRLPDGALFALEDDVNAHIQADVPIRCWFPGDEELAALPLRKPPAVKTHVRVVQIGDDEFCACGGTHPSTAGQVGLLKIIDARPSRGKLRLTFLCGKRAFLDYRKRAALGEAAAFALSTGVDNLPGAVEALLARAKDAEYHLNRARRESALASVADILRGAKAAGGARVAQRAFSRLGMDALREVAGEIAKTPGCVALLADETEKGDCLLVFARAEDVSLDMGRLMRNCGGKGGGKPDFAQGAAKSAQALDEAFTQIQCAFDE